MNSGIGVQFYDGMLAGFDETNLGFFNVCFYPVARRVHDHEHGLASLYELTLVRIFSDDDASNRASDSHEAQLVS